MHLVGRVGIPMSGAMAAVAMVLLVVGLLPGCGGVANEAGDAKGSGTRVTGLTDVEPLLEYAIVVLAAEPSGAKLDWSKAQAGDPLPKYVYRVRATSPDPWAALPDEPSEYLVPISIDGVNVAEMVVFRSGDGWDLGGVAVGTDDWTAIDSATEMVRGVIGEEADMRVVSGAWTAVIGRGVDEALAVVFCLPRMGVRLPGPKGLTRAEEQAMSAIDEQRVYAGDEAQQRIREAFPSVFRADPVKV